MTRHRQELRILPPAVLGERGIDLMAGEAILLHLKPRPSAGWLVVNTPDAAGGWGPEFRLPLPPDAAAAALTVVLEGEGETLDIRLGEAAPARFPRPLRLGDGSAWRLPPGVQERLPAESPGAPAARIDFADRHHLRFRLQDLPPGRSLSLRADGLPCAALPTGDVPAEGAATLRYAADSLVLEGMRLELLLEGEEPPRCLARTRVASRYCGAIEMADEAGLCGWALNPALPEEPVVVDVYLDGRFQGAARADRSRPDLARLGPGFGRSGFLFRLPRRVFPREGVPLRLETRIQDTRFALRHSPWWLSRPVPVTAAALGGEPAE